jgi:hypothetical protein
VGPGRQFAGPLTPYRTGPEALWTPRAGGPLVELPMAVEPTTRVPFIGTTITTLPRALVDAAARQVARLPLVNLELHAIDLVDASDHPALTELAGAQRDVRVPVAEKLARLDAVLGVLTRTHASTTLASRSSRPAWPAAPRPAAVVAPPPVAPPPHVAIVSSAAVSGLPA